MHGTEAVVRHNAIIPQSLSPIPHSEWMVDQQTRSLLKLEKSRRNFFQFLHAI